MRYSFLVMQADGEQLTSIAALADAGVLTPGVDRVLPFHETNEAMNHVAGGRAKGKVVIAIATSPVRTVELVPFAVDE